MSGYRQEFQIRNASRKHVLFISSDVPRAYLLDAGSAAARLLHLVRRAAQQEE